MNTRERAHASIVPRRGLITGLREYIFVLLAETVDNRRRDSLPSYAPGTESMGIGEIPRVS